MATSIINHDAFLAQLKDHINEEMIKAAEPIIKDCLIEIEKEMRKKLGACLISIINQNFEMERMGADLRILIRGHNERN